MFGSPKKPTRHERISIIDGIAPGLDKLLNAKKESLFNPELRKDRNDDDFSGLDSPVPVNDVETVITVSCGRIKFAGIIVPPDAPTDLVCEECEKAFSVYFCSACAQVQCAQCADMVHPKGYGGALLHPHETEDKIRPVQRGDKSKIVIDKSFYLPDTELRQDEYNLVKDLSVPNSLAINKEVTVNISKNAFKHTAKFTVNQIMLFVDPHTGKEVYGKILSEWDYRHSAAAPAIIRGDGAVVYYIVQMLGSMQHSAKIEQLEQLCRNETNKGVSRITDVADLRDDNYALLEDLQHDPDRAHYYHAHIINKRVREMRNIQILGPKYHLRQIGSDEAVDNMYDVNHDSLINTSNSRQLMAKSNYNGFLLDDDDEEDGHSVLSDIHSVQSYVIAATDKKQSRLKAQEKLSLGKSQSTAAMLQSIHKSRVSSTLNDVDIDVEAERQLLANNVNANRQLFLSKSQKILNNIDREAYNTVDKEIYADIDTDEQSQMTQDNANKLPYPAVLRSYEDVINRQIECSTKQGMAYYSLDYQRVLQSRNVLVISESDLIGIEDHLTKLRKRKDEVLRRVLQCSMFSTDMMKKFKKFNIWKNSLEHLKTRQKHCAMTRIQSRARVWLCRNKLAEKTTQWHETLELMRQKVHNQFRYSDSSDPSAITMNDKIYFKTHADLNRYAAFLRLAITRIVGFQTRKRQFLLRKSVAHWKGAVGSYLEENLVMSHFNAETEDDLGAGKEKFESITQQKDIIARKHIAVEHIEQIKTKLQSAGEFDYDTVVALPLRMKDPHNNPVRVKRNIRGSVALQLLDQQRALSQSMLCNGEDVDSNSNDPVLEQQLTLSVSAVSAAAAATSSALTLTKTDQITTFAETVPSYFPSEGIELPPLIAVFDPKSAEGRLTVKSERRVDKMTYRAVMEGPSFDSSWAIPGRVIFGGMPWGPASGEVNTVIRKNQVSSISALLLSGVDVFVSLLQPEEEEALEIEHSIPRIESSTMTAFETTRVAVNQLVMDNSAIISKQQAQIDAIPKFGKSDPRYPAAYRETLRCKARINLAEECIKRTQAQIKNLSTSIEWTRIPLHCDRVPSVNEMLPHIWHLEKYLRNGKNVFLYSKDGHGRAGMVAAMLLGRLYGLHPYETMYRIQACHDCSKREEHRHIPITCPQLPVQRQLLTDMLTLSNRVLENVTIRSQVDPETFVDNHRPRSTMAAIVHHQVDTKHPRKGGVHAHHHPHTETVERYEPPDSQPPGVVRHKQSLYFEHELPPVSPVTLSPEMKTKLKMLKETDVLSLYDSVDLGQSKDVVRVVPIQRPEPAELPTQPLLRGNKGLLEGLRDRKNKRK